MGQQLVFLVLARRILGTQMKDNRWLQQRKVQTKGIHPLDPQSLEKLCF